MNAIDVIRGQHADLEALLDKAIEAAQPERAALIREIGDRFAAHATMEETLFYPAFATSDAARVLAEYARDHQAIRERLAALTAEPDIVAAAPLLDLRAAVREHAIHDEEARLLPLVQRALSAGQLEALGIEMLAFHDELMTHSPWRSLAPDARRAATP